MFSYRKFVQLLKENLNDEIILYRGDSTDITYFDSSKFDNKAIYGLGLYLTDNYDIAYSYTLKGGNNGIVTELNFDIDDKNDAIEFFVITYLLNSVNSTDFTDEELYELCDNIILPYKKYRKFDYERYKSGDKFFFLDKDILKTLNKTRLEEYLLEFDKQEERLLNNINKYENAIKKYGKYLDKAYKKYDEIKDSISFVKGNQMWSVISKEKNSGKVSEFSIKKDVINKCYDANIVISNDIESVLKKFVNRYNKQNNIIEYTNKNHIISDKLKNDLKFAELKKRATNYNNQDFTLSNFFYENRCFRYNDTIIETDTWKFFISEMQKLGYCGIVYDGGEHLRTGLEHKAYVIWKMSDVKRIK